jgi:hypothetical protein
VLLAWGLIHHLIEYPLRRMYSAPFPRGCYTFNGSTVRSGQVPPYTSNGRCIGRRLYASTRAAIRPEIRKLHSSRDPFSRQVTTQDQDTDAIRHPLKLLHGSPAVGHGLSFSMIAGHCVRRFHLSQLATRVTGNFRRFLAAAGWSFQHELVLPFLDLEVPLLPPMFDAQVTLGELSMLAQSVM